MVANRKPARGKPRAAVDKIEVWIKTSGQNMFTCRDVDVDGRYLKYLADNGWIMSLGVIIIGNCRLKRYSLGIARQNIDIC